MAKAEKLIRILGTFNGINFYCRQGKYYARKAGGGFNREAIKNSPKMKGVRQNNSEFGKVSTTKKHFKKSLEPVLEEVNHPKLHASLMSLFQNIKNYDSQSARGSRNIFKGLESEAGQQLLENFHFFPQQPLPGDIIRQLKLKKLDGRLSFEGVSIPTNVKAEYLLQSLCLHFDFETNAYQLESSQALVFGKDDVPEHTEFLLPPLPGDNIWLLHFKKLSSASKEPKDFGLSVVGWVRL